MCTFSWMQWAQDMQVYVKGRFGLSSWVANTQRNHRSKRSGEYPIGYGCRFFGVAPNFVCLIRFLVWFLM